MPIILIALIASCVGGAGVFYGRDQYKKRAADQVKHAEQVKLLEKALRELEARLGTAHEQVRTLAAIVEQLRRDQRRAA
jgi:uncharacterized protein YlxW (UPF0749 family)